MSLKTSTKDRAFCLMDVHPLYKCDFPFNFKFELLLMP